jgi:hypothetical protein
MHRYYLYFTYQCTATGQDFHHHALVEAATEAELEALDYAWQLSVAASAAANGHQFDPAMTEGGWVPADAPEAELWAGVEPGYYD